MNGDTVLWAVVIAAVLVSFANPGGWIIGGGIAVLLVGGRYGIPYAGDYLKERQSGLSAARARSKTREKLRGGDARDRRRDR